MSVRRLKLLEIAEVRGVALAPLLNPQGDLHVTQLHLSHTHSVPFIYNNPAEAAGARQAAAAIHGGRKTVPHRPRRGCSRRGAVAQGIHRS